MALLLQKKWVIKTQTLTVYVLLGLFFQSGICQIPSAKDCPTAMRICDVTQNYYFEVIANNIGLIDDAYGLSMIYCQASSFTPYWEYTPAWFVFTPQYSGEFGFLICPEVTTTNWDYALFENPVCNNLNNATYHLSCDTSPPNSLVQGCNGLGFKNGFGGGGNGLGPYINVTAGNTYVLYTYARTFVSDPTALIHRATLSFQGAVVTAHPDLFTIPSCLMNAEGFTKNQVKVIPNPFTNTIQIESEITFTTLIMYDVVGKQIVNQKFTNQIATENLAKGIYFLHLIDNEGNKVVKKLVKE